MTMRNCLANIIRGRWFRLLGVVCLAAALVTAAKRAAKPAVKPADLATLVRSYRESPSPARRAAVEAYAARHPQEAALARLAVGIAAFEQKDFAAAIEALRKAEGKLPQLADYTGYYLAAARVESQEATDVAAGLATVHSGEVRSLFAGRAWLVEARALKTADPLQAARLLRQHYSELPQPEGDVTLADCYQAAGDLAHAADFYQRVYYQYLTGDSVTRSAAALLALKDAMGAGYPEPLPGQMLRRADRLLEARAYGEARSEYRSIAERVAGLERDQARVRAARADFLDGKTSAACSLLRGLALGASEADAERFYYLQECARQSGDDEAMQAAVRQLGEKFPQSPWRLKALVSAANRFLLVNRPEEYVPLYQAAYEDFPSDPAAGLCHWKVTFHAYLSGDARAGDLLREHLRRYPTHPSTGAAVYFLGRLAEAGNDFSAARACYELLDKSYQNHYYAVPARERLRRPEIAVAPASSGTVQFLAGLAFPAAKPVPAEKTPATSVRIERSRLLRTAGLNDLADGELRFGARNGGQTALLALEMAGAADAPYQAMRIMKSMAPGYLDLPLNDAPRQFWDLLFPLPYRGELLLDARQRNLDPYLLAGLIRQESEFNPEAVSRANAYGLTQVRPATGRLFARRAGVPRYNTRLLLQPAANLKIGTAIFRSMLDQNGGRIVETLAAYNAGPSRVAEWRSWYTYREPAEFVEAIPFSETREYVQAVLRNAEFYRRLYDRLEDGKAVAQRKGAR